MVISRSRSPHARPHPSVEATRTRSEGRKGRSTFDQNADLFPEIFSGEYNSIFEKFLASKLERNTQIFDNFLQEIFQGSYPFSKTNLQGFTRTQTDFSRALKFTLTPTHKISMLILLTAFQTLDEFNRFPELSRTSCLFPGLSSPGKCQNKIAGLSRTHTNPEFFGSFRLILLPEFSYPESSTRLSRKLREIPALFALVWEVSECLVE